MSSEVDNFWNELALAQMASGGAPSVITKSMRKALDGDKKEASKIRSEVDVNKVKHDIMLEVIRKVKGK